MAQERHEVWREHYRLDRYMNHLNQADLDQRMEHVFSNLSVLTHEGKIGLLPVNDKNEQWMILWTHLLEEYGLRSISIPSRKLPRQGDTSRGELLVSRLARYMAGGNPANASWGRSSL